jgi:glutamine synthetase
VNPYRALAGMIAAGLHGIDNELELEPPYEGNAYVSDKPRVPDRIEEAAELFGSSQIVREAFGQDVVDHYLNRARIEVDTFKAAVTDWEKYRGFERL